MSATNDSRPSIERRPTATRPLRTTNSSSASSLLLEDHEVALALDAARRLPPAARSVVLVEGREQLAAGEQVDVVHVGERQISKAATCPVPTRPARRPGLTRTWPAARAGGRAGILENPPVVPSREQNVI